MIDFLFVSILLIDIFIMISNLDLTVVLPPSHSLGSNGSHYSHVLGLYFAFSIGSLSIYTLGVCFFFPLHLNLSTTQYCITLKISLYFCTIWKSICLLTFLLTYGFIGLASVCNEMGDPFGDDANDFDQVNLALVSIKCSFHIL